MATLENEFLKISIREKGAEMTSFFNKNTRTEHLWQAHPDVWPWHAPNLFPVVGGCINNQLIIDGKHYPMPRHGFARHTDFTLVEQAEDSAKFSLSYNSETLEVYPYKFAFQVLYVLENKNLRITYKVVNYDEKANYFSVGAHPAFNVPFLTTESQQDYFLEFEHNEPLVSHLLSPDGFFNGETQTLPQVKNTLPITPNMFEKDALVFKNLKSRKVSIKSKKHSDSLYIQYSNFNYFGIWGKRNAPFICLEPWIGCADTEGKTVDIKEKEGIYKLDKGHVFEAFFSIGIS